VALWALQVLRVTLAQSDYRGNQELQVNKEVLGIQGQLAKRAMLATSVRSDCLEEPVQLVFKDSQEQLVSLATKVHKEARVLKEWPDSLVLQD